MNRQAVVVMTSLALKKLGVTVSHVTHQMAVTSLPYLILLSLRTLTVSFCLGIIMSFSIAVGFNLCLKYLIVIIPVFLQEVIDSLARGYEEKLKNDYLILEINSSRYAYNIQLHEVNFFVVRALLSIPVLAETKNVLSTVKDILKYFRPVLSNYIKTKSSIMDCLRAVEVSFILYCSCLLELA